MLQPGDAIGVSDPYVIDEGVYDPCTIESTGLARVDLVVSGAVAPALEAPGQLISDVNWPRAKKWKKASLPAYESIQQGTRFYVREITDVAGSKASDVWIDIAVERSAHGPTFTGLSIEAVIRKKGSRRIPRRGDRCKSRSYAMASTHRPFPPNQVRVNRWRCRKLMDGEIVTVDVSQINAAELVPYYQRTHGRE